MRVVLQRVSHATVTIDGRIAGAIDAGYCLLVGFEAADTAAVADWMADKIVGLRLFGDHDLKMNRSLGDVGGAILVISQFTLYGDVQKGRRPSFVKAAKPDTAIPLYEHFISRLRSHDVVVETGEFGAMMEVAIHNDGPVTLVLERAP